MKEARHKSAPRPREDLIGWARPGFVIAAVRGWSYFSTDVPLS